MITLKKYANSLSLNQCMYGIDGMPKDEYKSKINEIKKRIVELKEKVNKTKRIAERFSNLLLYSVINISAGFVCLIPFLWSYPIILIPYVLISVLTFSILYYLVERSPKKAQNSLNYLGGKKRIFELKHKIGQIKLVINDGNRKFDEENITDALQLFQKALNHLKSLPEKSKFYDNIEKRFNFTDLAIWQKKALNQVHKKLNEIHKKLNEINISEINDIINKGKTLKDQNQCKEAMVVFDNALNRSKKLFIASAKDQIINDIKSLKDETNLIEVIKLIEQGKNLKKQKEFDNAIQIFQSGLKLIEKMYFPGKRKTEIQKLKNSIDEIYSFQIDNKIETGNQFRKQMKIDNSIIILNKSLNIAKKMYNTHKKNKESSRIKSLINQTRIAKIKSMILKLGTMFPRLQINEIAEESGENEEQIILTVREMIRGQEIHAKYFESSKSVAFNQQANIEEIDKLMEHYKKWEKEGIGKK